MRDTKKKLLILWQQLLKQQPTNEDLRYIIEFIKPLRQEAWQQLLKQQPTNEVLRYIIEFIKSLRQEAQKK
jgi:hypothetical protein